MQLSKKEVEKPARKFSRIANVARISSAVRRRKSGESQSREMSETIIGADEVNLSVCLKNKSK